MRQHRIHTCAFFMLIVASGCGTSVEDACNNATEQCMLETEDTDQCVSDLGALEESDTLNQDALDCVADAASCEEVQACPEAELPADEEAESNAGSGGLQS